jgi:hypothetical protein
MVFSSAFFNLASLILVAYIARVIWDIGRNNARQSEQGKK